MHRWTDRLTLGPWRRRRQVDRLLVDLGLAPGTVSPPRDATDRPRRSRVRTARSPRRGRVTRRRAAGRTRGAITLATAGALTLLAVPVATEQMTGWDLGIGPSWGGGSKVDPFDPRSDPRPPAGVEAAVSPLGRPPSVSGRGGFTFMHVDRDGEPAAPDPCRPMHLVVSGQAPTGSSRVVEEAATLLSEATGLHLSVEGVTDEQAAEQRAPYQPDRYGERWAPVLVAWTDPGADPGLRGHVAGLAGPSVQTDRGGQTVVVSGQASLDRPQLGRLSQEPGGDAGVRSVVVHELAHVLGLGHVDDPESLMHPRGAANELSEGDRRGLARLGSGPCVPGL